MTVPPAVNLRTAACVVVAAWTLLAVYQLRRQAYGPPPASPFSLEQALHPPPLNVTLAADAACPTTGLPPAAGQWVDECMDQRHVPWDLPLPDVGAPTTRAELIAARQRLAAYVYAHQSRLLQRALPAGCAPKVVTYVCRADMSCGGLGDRIRGITIAFFQALLTNSIVVVELTRPLPLTTFFHSAVLSPAAQAAWLSCRGAGRVASWHAIDSGHLQTFDYRQGWRDADAIDVTTNAAPYSTIWGNPHLTQPLAAAGLSNISYPLAASLAMYLHHGQPTPLLRDTVRPLLALLDPGRAGVIRVGLQIRTGGDGSFPDPARHPVASTSVQFAAKALEVCAARRAAACVLFITSDHPQSVQIVNQHLVDAGAHNGRQHPGGQAVDYTMTSFDLRLVYHTQAILHLDRDAGGGPVLEAVAKPYADWYVLAYHMDHLLISSSGYGVSAALANFTHHDMFSMGAGAFVDAAACEEHHCQQLRGAW